MSIVSTKVKIYSNEALTNLVATVNGTTSLTQTLTITGLNSSTTYWAVAEATDNNNLTGYSVAQMFTTAGASYVFSNETVQYESSYDTLFVGVDVGPSGMTFTECGVQFALNSDFSGTLITATNNNNFFSGDVTGFSEHTTYYYRFFATTTEYGTQYYTPTNNSITTHYDEPTLGITASSVTDNTASLTFSYTGNYPIDTVNYSDVHAYYMVDGASPSSATYLQFATLDNNVPETLHLSGLQSNTTYYVEINVDFYDGEVTQSITFTTLGARPSVAITGISNITPSGADVGISIS